VVEAGMLNLKSKIAQEVLGYFMLHETSEMYVNEIARHLHLDSGNLTRKLKELAAEGVLKSETKGNLLYYSLNTAFPLLKEYRRIVLKTVGFEYGLKEALRGVKGLRKAILFGSYAQDKMDVSSDIDLLAVGEHNSIDLHREIAEFQKKMEREINVINMSYEEYEKRRQHNDPLLKSIYRKKRIQLL